MSSVATLLATASTEADRLEHKARLHAKRIRELAEQARLLQDHLEYLRHKREERERLVLERWRQRKQIRALRPLLEGEVTRARPVGSPGRNPRSWKQCRITAIERFRQMLFAAARDIPDGCAQPGVYVLFRGKEIVYIGQSLNVLQRIGEHGRTKQFNAACFLPCKPKDLLTAERLLLDLFVPPDNADRATRNRREFLSVDAGVDAENPPAASP